MMSKLKRSSSTVWKQVRFSLHNLTVEPIIAIVFLGWVFANIFQYPAVYRRICETYIHNASINCYQINDSKVEDTVQEHSAEWTFFTAIAYLVPALFADTILGAYGDRNGRKLNLVLGIFGVAFAEVGYLLTLSSVATPLWTILVFGAIAGFTGYIAMIPVSCNAYIADVTEDPSVLTIRSGLFSAVQLLASVVGAFLAAALADVINVSIAIEIEIGLFAVALVYIIWKIPQKPGLREIDRRTKESPSPYSNDGSPTPSYKETSKKFLKEVLDLLRSGVSTYRKKREGHRRIFIFVAVAVLMLSYTTAVETRTSGIINSFVMRRTDSNSLGWSTRELGLWNGSGYAILLFGTLFGLVLFKKVFHLRETSIILIGLLSSTLRTLLIAGASSDWLMYVANALGLFSGLVQPAVVSFISQIVANDEIGRVFSLFGICADISYIVTTLIYAHIYRATVPWAPNFLFYLLGAIQLIAIAAMIWVHIQSKREGLSKTKEQGPTNIRHAISQIGEESHRSVEANSMNGKVHSKKHISIMEHAAKLETQRADMDIWASREDLRMGSNGNVNFY